MVQQQIIQEIKNRTNIIDIIGNYVLLKSRGRNYIGLCPFHKEKTPSFNVSLDSQFYHCFGCKEHGDVINFIMSVESLDFNNALNFLADKCGISIDHKRNLKDENRQFAGYFKCLELANEYFIKNINSDTGKEVRKYLRSRNISNTIFKSFNLGYAANDWNGLSNYLIKKGIKEQLIIDLGLKKKDKTRSYDFFNDRLIFPIADNKKRIIGFAGRRLDSKLPKYINSSESVLYHKNQTLYGIDLAIEHWLKKKRAIIVEGYMDVCQTHQFGFGETVASCGTSLTKQQIKKISSYVNSIYILFDNDSAGSAAVLKSIPILLEEQINSYIIELPAGSDPDQFLIENKENKLKKLIYNAISTEDYLLKINYKKFITSNVTEQSNIIDQLSNYYLNNKQKHNLWLSKIANRFELKSSIMTNKNKLSKIKYTPSNLDHSRNDNRFNKNYYIKLNRDFNNNGRFELDILRILFKFPESLEIIKNNVDKQTFQNKDLKELFNEFIQLSQSDRLGLNINSFYKIFNNHIQLIGYINQTLYEISINQYEKKIIEQYIFKMLRSGILINQKNKIRQTDDVKQQEAIIKESSEKIKEISQFKHFK